MKEIKIKLKSTAKSPSTPEVTPTPLQEHVSTDTPSLTPEEIVEEKTKYTRKMYTPIYEPNSSRPVLSDLYCTEKRDELLKEIEDDKELTSDMREFLKSAAERHTSFNFSKIADFYSHLPIKYKSHFENSALVIIDYDQAVRNGFISFDKEVQESRIDYLENIITNEKLASNKEEIEIKKLKRAEEELEFLKSKTPEVEDIFSEDEW